MKTIALIGASGVLGRQAGPRLRAAGHRLRLLLRPGSPDALPHAPGVERFHGDLFDAVALRRLLRGCDAAVNLASALKPVHGSIDWQANDRVRAEGTMALVKACEAAGVGRLVQLGIAFVDGEDAEGTGPLAALPWLASAASMEAEVAQARLDALVLRAGLFWGPGTGMQAWFDSLRTPSPWYCPGMAADWVSLVHVEDMADAVVAAVGSQATGCLAVTDGEPLRWSDLAASVQAELGGADIEFAPRAMLPSFRVSAASCRARLTCRPNHLGRDFARLSSAEHVA